MRLDWFLPVLRKPKPNQPAPKKSGLMRLSRRLLPTGFFSDPETKRRGWARRALRWLGPVWLSSPVRRIVQTVAFVVFLWLFFWVCWPYSAEPGPTTEAGWPSHYADNLAQKEAIAAEFFLVIDPLVSLSTGIASRAWVWSLVCAGVILLVCVLIPRGFCGYLCPLGSLIDLFDWAVGKRVTRFRVPEDGWWVHIKYYLLLGVLIAALWGVLLSGFVAAIPVITRGFLFLFHPIQNGAANGWHQVPPWNWGHAVSLVLFFGVLFLGFLRPRFWCKYVCPSGAVFSLGNFFRISERKVESSCIHCNKCVEICPFDAIKPDFTTRTNDCTLCQSCAGVCPTEAIKFVGRWEFVDLKVENDPPTHETPIGRRGFLAASVGVAAGTIGGLGGAALTKSFGANLDDPDSPRPGSPSGKCAGTRVSANVHPLRGVLQSLPE